VSRHGYTDDYDGEDNGAMWRGMIASATRGKRGQAFFRALLAALDAMPAKRLVDGELEKDGDYCALGVLAKAKGAVLAGLDTTDWDSLGSLFDIAPQLAQEVMCINDESVDWTQHSTECAPEERWRIVRGWVARQIRTRADELLPVAQDPKP
jgi:hypothetical protein